MQAVKRGCLTKWSIQRPFLHDLPTGHVDENGIILHAAKLGGADQTVSGTGVRVRLDRDHGFQSIVIINSRAS